MKHVLKIVLMWIVAHYAIPGASQTLVSLDSILSVVKEKNPIMKNYRSRAGAMQAYAQGSGSWMAPEVGGGLWMVPYKRVSDQRDKGQVMISVQQKFTNPAKLRASKGYQESKAGVVEAEQGIVFNELRTAARLAYLQWIILEKKKRVLAQSEEIVKLIQSVAQARYPYNQSKLGQVFKAEARIQEIRNMMLMNDNQIVQRNIQLNQLMNVSDGTRFTIDTTYRLPDLSTEADDTAHFAGRRSDVKKIDRSIQSMRLNQAVENSQAKPDFNLSFNHMIARGTGMPNQFMLLGMVSLPIAPWSSKGYKANVQGMSKEIEAMQNERNSILSEAIAASAGMKADIMTLRKQIGNYEKRIIPALRKNYGSTMLAYEENKEEMFVVIDAWETLNATQLQYLDTMQKLYEAMVEYGRTVEN